MTNEQIFRSGERRRRRVVVGITAAVGIAIVAAVTAMSALPASQAQTVEPPVPTVKTVTAEHEDEATTVIAEHREFDEQLHDLVDTSGILGNSQNISDALSADEDLRVSVTLGHTEYARALLVGTLATALDREASVHPGADSAALVRLAEIRDVILADPDAAFSTIGSPPLAQEIAGLLASIRG